MRNAKTLAVLNTLLFLLHLVPGLLNSHTIGDVSAKYPALFTPAGINPTPIPGSGSYFSYNR